MMWIALFALAVYVALKSGQFAFLGRDAGYRVEPVGLGQRLRTGEPALLFIAALISLPPALAGVWYHKHKFEKVLGESIACYSLIQAYQQAPRIKGSEGEYAVYEATYSYRGTALDAARQLGLDDRVIQQRLDQTASTTVAERSRADERIYRARLAATQRCLHSPKDAPNT